MQDKHLTKEIKSRPPLTHEYSDEELANRARSLLRWKIRYDSIHVNSDKGQLTLSGEVDLDLDRETAERTVRRLTGVVGVTNTIVTKAHGIRNAERLGPDYEGAPR